MSFNIVLLYFASFAILWCYPAASAPMPDENATMEENSIMEEENKTSSCFRDTFPQHLQLHYDLCMSNNLSEENAVKTIDVLSCVIQAAGAVSSEEAVDISKLGIVLMEDEESVDVQPPEDSSLFSESVNRCNENVDVKMPEDFVQCLFEALSMSCTNSTVIEEESSSSETSEEM